MSCGKCLYKKRNMGLVLQIHYATLFLVHERPGKAAHGTIDVPPAPPPHSQCLIDHIALFIVSPQETIFDWRGLQLVHSLALVQESFCSVYEMTLPFSESHQNVVRLATFWSEIFMPLSDTHGLPSHLTHVTYPGYPYRLGRGKGCFHYMYLGCSNHW